MLARIFSLNLLIDAKTDVQANEFSRWADEHTQVIKTEHTYSSVKYYVIFKYYMKAACSRARTLLGLVGWQLAGKKNVHIVEHYKVLTSALKTVFIGQHQ